MRILRNILPVYFFLLAFAAPWEVRASSFDDGSFSYAVGFSPGREAKNIILNGIEEAVQSIRVAAYSFTCKDISLALLRAHKRGVKVLVIADEKSSTGKYSAVTFLANLGIPVRVNGNYAIFHHKFMIFDDLHIETGSYNYSAAAAGKNAENVLMLRNVPELAGEYVRQWEALWRESVPVLPRY